MTTTAKKTDYSLSLGKTILFVIACISIFILMAVIADLLTSWITFKVLRIVIREILLRMPLTVFSLHFFAVWVIKKYNPSTIYGKLTLLNTVKWIAIGFILPGAVWLFYYSFHFIVPFPHSISLNTEDELSLSIKWVAISVAAGLTEEVLFRGHLFMIISNRCSKFQAMLITSLIFGLVHIAMLTSFNLVDILIVVAGGAIVGMMFSVIYVYTKAIWYAAIVHVIWDIFFFIGKITTLAATQADANQAIMAFKLTTKNLLLTGGNFGMEAALPCLMVYLVVIAILYRRGYPHS